MVTSCVGLLLLSRMVSRLISVTAGINISWPNDSPLYKHTASCLSIHQWVTSTLSIMLLWTFTYKILYEHVLTIFGIYLGVELMDYMVTPCLSLGTTKIVFWRGFTILCSHQQCVKVPISPYPCQTYWIPFSLLLPSGYEAVSRGDFDLHFSKD